MESDEENEVPQPTIIHSGLSFFPTYRQILTFLLLCIIECQGIYICLPLNKNSNVSFLIGQIFLFVIIFYSWYMVLHVTPGPMSQLFNEEFVKKTIEQGLQAQTQTQNKVCTRCQIEAMAKLYHCQQCNRCVYKGYFHSKWLNTCIAKENFPQFTSFLVFLEFYLILLEIDNIIFFVQLRSANQDTFADFFAASFENVLVSCALFITSALILMVMSMLAGSFFMALRVKGNVQPLSCKPGCDGLRKKSSQDKLMMRLRQSIRQSNMFGFGHNFQNEEDSHHDIFRQTQDLTGKQLNIKSLKKSIMLQSKSNQKDKQKERDSICSIEDYQGPYFKTDFFESAKIFRKKQNSIQRKKKISRLSGLMGEDLSKMTASKWKRYIKSTFEKDYHCKRSSKLEEVLEKKSEENAQTPMELLKEKDQMKENDVDTTHEEPTQSSFRKRKLISRSAKNDNDLACSKETPQGPPQIKKLRFVKKSDNKLTEIYEKDEKLEGE